MNALIQVGGIALLIVLAVLVTRPEWRLPAIAFALLALPGNVDNLMPQMALDPHPLPNNTAPAISALDLLLAWAVALTLRERRSVGPAGRRVIAAGVLVAALAAVPSLIALASGVEPLAVVRGIILFSRIPVLLYLAFALQTELRDPTRLLAGVAAGGCVLIANVIYITTQSGADRFTAATFGRNGLAIALVVVCIACAGLAYHRWSRGRRWRLVAVVAAGIAGVALFVTLGTGTRMSVLLLGAVAALALGLGLGRPWRRLAGAVGATMLVVAVALTASTALTASSLRTISIITNAGDAIDEAVVSVTRPEELPVYSTVVSRTQFWDPALAMVRANPLRGVGPFQWNIERYGLDSKAPVVVADTHNSYLQVAAEYGLIVLGAYVALYFGIAVLVVVQLIRRRWQGTLTWGAAALGLAALILPLADVTNSHLANVRMGPLTWLIIGSAAAVLLASDGLDRPSESTAVESPQAVTP